MPRADDFDLELDDHALRVRRIHVAGAPDAPVLVFLHDSLGSIATWREFPERLAGRVGLNALVFDRRGYGESSPFGGTPRTPGYLEDEAVVLGRLLEALDVRSAVLFGHSDGASIALIAAALFPDRVDAVISEAAHVFVEEETLSGIRHARETLRTTNLRERLVRYHGDKTDAVTSAWIDTWLLPEYRDWNIERYLPRIACPTLVIQGNRDEYGTEAQVRAIVDGIGDRARALLLPGVGHTPHREAADVVLDAAASFLRNRET